MRRILLFALPAVMLFAYACKPIPPDGNIGNSGAASKTTAIESFDPFHPQGDKQNETS